MKPDAKDDSAKRVFIVDDHPIAREGVAVLIGRQSHLSFCGEAENITKALAGIAESMPHVVLIDLSLKSENGLELVKRLRSHDESIQLLVWSMHPEGVYAERVLRAGANGYIEKSNAASELVEAINTVLGGKVYLSETMSSKLLLRATGKCTEQTPQSAIETLTDRELEMFGLLGNGMTTQQIAATMHVSQKTVDTYRARIKEKLGLANSSELVFSAIRWVAESSQTKKPPVADI